MAFILDSVCSFFLKYGCDVLKAALFCRSYEIGGSPKSPTLQTVGAGHFALLALTKSERMGEERGPA